MKIALQLTCIIVFCFSLTASDEHSHKVRYLHMSFKHLTCIIFVYDVDGRSFILG